jgi:cytoskeleton protein RodZ
MASPKRKIGQQDFFDHSANNVAEAEVIAMAIPETQRTERQPKQQPLRIGEILKREREKRGYDLQQIADYLCIRRSLLAALENSRYEEFPADAYVIGFLRSYAELIGIPGQEAINCYRQEMAGRRKQPDLVLPTPVSEGRAPTAVIMGAAALASLLIYILWYAVSTSDRTTVSAPPVLPQTVEAPATAPAPLTQQPATVSATTEMLPASAPSGIAIAAPAPLQKSLAPVAAPTASAAPNDAATQPAPASASAAATATAAKSSPPATTSTAHIRIKAEQSSWILIADDKGQTVYDHVMKPGEVYQVPNTPGLTLTTGNGAGIVVTLDGVDMPRLSTTTSHIVRNLPLETNALKALPQQPTQ